jgi:hypothetical protein
MEDKRNVEIARSVYKTPEGRALLADILNDNKLFAMDNDSISDLVEENSAKRLLYKLGIWREHNLMRIVNALMSMPYSDEEEPNVKDL